MSLPTTPELTHRDAQLAALQAMTDPAEYHLAAGAAVSLMPIRDDAPELQITLTEIGQDPGADESLSELRFTWSCIVPDADDTPAQTRALQLLTDLRKALCPRWREPGQTREVDIQIQTNEAFVRLDYTTAVYLGY